MESLLLKIIFKDLGLFKSLPIYIVTSTKAHTVFLQGLVMIYY